MEIVKQLLLIHQVIGLETWTNGPSFDMSFDSSNQSIKFEVLLPKDQYLAIGFGDSMDDTDMVLF